MRVKESIIGCLSLRVSSLSIPDYCSVSAESVKEPVTISADAANSTVYVYINNNNDKLICGIIPKNVLPKLKKKQQNIKINITAALICQVSLGVYEYFYVTEGPLIVEEGYFKVRRR